MKVSVVIANYNNSKFIKECIESLNNQTYKNIEIIFFDDNSQDNSLEVINRYKNIKIIKNKIQTKFGSFNQMNAFKESIQSSTGEIIFLLDSDDYFREDKIEKVVDFFLKNKNENIVFDYPIIKKNNEEIPQNKKVNFFNTYWGYIHPTSCISTRRDFAKKTLKSISLYHFTDIWMDLRFLIHSKYLDNNYFTINENLTYYRQTESNISSRFNKFSKNWWKRRSQAHDYVFNFAKENNIKIKKNVDYFITKIIDYII